MQLREKDILGCLPLLASVLGNTYGVHVRIGGSDACTDGNMIQLPSLPVDCGEELLLLVRGFIDHESAHIRYTDFKAFKEAALDAVTKNLFNAIEDWRVENRLAAVFPGCRHNFHELIHRFSVEDATRERAGEISLALSVLNYVLLTVRSWDVPEVSQPLEEETTDSLWISSLHKSGRNAQIRPVPSIMPASWHIASSPGNPRHRRNNTRRVEPRRKIPPHRKKAAKQAHPRIQLMGHHLRKTHAHRQRKQDRIFFLVSRQSWTLCQ